MKRVSWPGVIVVAGSTIYSWFNVSPPVSPAARTGEAAAAIDRSAQAGGHEVSSDSIASMQLHDWSPKAPAQVRPDRNIFTFTRPAPKAAPAPPAQGAPGTTGLLAPGGDGLQPPLQLFKLIGVAEDAGPEGVTRTAIISGQGQLYLVKEGETVAWIYRVGRMSAGAVELLDTTGGPPLRLFLK